MAEWTDLVDSIFDSGKPGKGSIFKQMRDNLAAMAAGLTGAPKILNAALSDGTITNEKMLDYVAGSYPLARAENEDFVVNSSSWVKYKEIAVKRNGIVTTKFTLKNNSGNADNTAYGRIYVNGIAIGTSRATDSTTYVTYTEDITIIPGDLIQLYLSNQNALGTNTYSNLLGLYSSVDTIDGCSVTNL